MNLTDFNDTQRRALLDLTMLAMYADGHLAAAEDERVGRLLAALGCETDYDRAKHYDASVARTRHHSGSTDSGRAYAALLARQFTTPAHRRQVLDVLDDLVTSDSSVAAQECGFLAVVREALQMP
ncbi:MAG: TerB family tellurite resistance protein [Limisphaerales bacterium]